MACHKQAKLTVLYKKNFPGQKISFFSEETFCKVFDFSLSGWLCPLARQLAIVNTEVILVWNLI